MKTDLLVPEKVVKVEKFKRVNTYARGCRKYLDNKHSAFRQILYISSRLYKGSLCVFDVFGVYCTALCVRKMIIKHLLFDVYFNVV